MTAINKFDLEIEIPVEIEIVHMENKVRFRGKKEDIDQFAGEFYKLKALTNGQLRKLGIYTLKVSDYMTEDRRKDNWIELPADAWGIMGSKFREVVFHEEDNPFDFNDCGYIENSFDIGVEVIDLPIRYTEFNDKDGSWQQRIINR